MKVFIVHRFATKKTAVSLLKSLASKGGIVLQPIVLDSSGGDAWKSIALSGINDCEAVAVYDSAECMKSANAVWEIEQARELKKPLILLDPVNIKLPPRNLQSVIKSCVAFGLSKFIMAFGLSYLSLLHANVMFSSVILEP